MAKYTQIGALVEKDLGLEAYHKLAESDGVIYAFIETGRSNDLFSEKQFGEFGEAAVLTVIVDETDHQEIFNQMFQYAELFDNDQGVMSLNTKIIDELKG